jgi:DNA-binding transcriptional MerR regulator
MTDTYTTAQVAEVVQIPLRKVISFVERGYIEPSIQDAAGHGSKRLWNYNDLIRCAVIAQLLDQFTVDYIRAMARHLKQDEHIGRDWLWLLYISQNNPAITIGELVVLKIEKSKDGSLFPGKTFETNCFKDIMTTSVQLFIDFFYIQAMVEDRVSRL